MTKSALRVLLVDDDEDDYMLTKDLLLEIKDYSVEVGWVSDYESALEAIKDGEYDVGLIDFQLGARTGLDLIEEARDMGFDAPLILLTGLNDRETDLRAMEIGAVDYLVKGEINASLLERSIRYSIADTRIRQALEDSEAKFRSLFDEAPIGYHELDTQGRVVTVNQTELKMLGYTAEEMTGCEMASLLVGGGITDGIEVSAGDLLATSLSGRIFEGAIRKKDGDILPILMETKPIADAEGNLIGFRGTLQDNSERQAIQRMKDEFVSVLSHELRTPLTSIRASLGLLSEGVVGDLPDQAHHMLDIATRNTDRLVRLINDVLDLERIQSGELSSGREVCYAPDLMKQSVDSLRDLASHSKVELVAEYQSAYINVDPDRIVQVFTNLVSNAIKFSLEDSSVTLAVNIDADEVVFSIRDQGRGIPADKIDSIFERFGQVEKSDSRQKGGTGLGLAISKGIVEQHGGRIWVESALGEGSTFLFSIPYSAEDQVAHSNSSPSSESDQPQGPVVLLCDDEESILKVAGDIIGGAGYTVITASTGQSAIDKCRQEKPDVLLLDLNLPDISGWDVLATLKSESETRDMPVLIFSGLPSQPDERPDLEIVGWIQKPWTIETLLLNVKNALGQASGYVPRLFLVEDDMDMTQILVAAFNRRGIDVIHARTGQEAMRFSQVLTPDVMVLDIMLPDGDGFDVVKWFQQREELGRVPLVVFTSKDLSAEEQDRLRLGPTEFITKGRVPLEQLEQQVNQFLGHLVSGK